MGIILRDYLPDPEEVFTERELTLIFANSMVCEPVGVTDDVRKDIVEQMLTFGIEDGGLTQEESVAVLSLLSDLGLSARESDRDAD